MLIERTAQPSFLQAYRTIVQERAARAHTPGAVAQPAAGRATQWVEVVADEVGEVLVQAMAINGVDYLFFSSGSDIMWYQESVVKLRSTGRPAPRLLNMLHEGPNLSAACGYSMVSGRPSVTAAHVEVGLLNYGGALHNAWRGGYPVLITTGKTPSSYGGTARGDRDQWVFWFQDFSDYGQIVRNYVKWDHDLHVYDNPGLIASRALQVVMTEPQGPAYLSISRDVAMTRVHGGRFPTAVQMGVPDPPAGDPDAIRRAARLLLDAQNPLVIAQQLGRDPRAVPRLVELCERLGLPYSAPRAERMNFPTTHPLFEGGPRLDEADVVLVLEATVPWLPGYQEPSPHARVIAIGLDPAASRYLHYEFTADLRIEADCATVLDQLLDETDRLLTEARRRAIAERKERIAAASRARREALDRRALSLAGNRPIAPAYLAYELGRALAEDAILLDEAVGNSANVQNYFHTSTPGSFYRSGGSSGGWGTGAAFGAKLAAPSRQVAIACGDGFFLYSVPYAALWAGVKYRIPFLTVVFQNLAYSTGTTSLARFYPEGYSLREQDFEGGWIEPPPDLARMAESVGAYGENVSEPEQVRPALQRALKLVDEGVPAVVAVRLPQLIKETMVRD